MTTVADHKQHRSKICSYVKINLRLCTLFNPRSRGQLPFVSSEDFPFTLMDLEQAQTQLDNKQWFYSTGEIAFSLILSYSSAPSVGQNLPLLLFKLSLLLRSCVFETNQQTKEAFSVGKEIFLIAKGNSFRQ